MARSESRALESSRPSGRYREQKPRRNEAPKERHPPPRRAASGRLERSAPAMYLTESDRHALDALDLGFPGLLMRSPPSSLTLQGQMLQATPRLSASICTSRTSVDERGARPAEPRQDSRLEGRPHAAMPSPARTRRTPPALAGIRQLEPFAGPFGHRSGFRDFPLGCDRSDLYGPC
jgi:hypothetical protein